MQRIKNYFDMMTHILKEKSDGDLMDYLHNINTPEEAMEVIKSLRYELVDISYNELKREMSKQTYQTKEELLARFEFIVEKQRGYPIGMGEYSDIEEGAGDWALENGYGHFFLEDD